MRNQDQDSTRNKWIAAWGRRGRRGRSSSSNNNNEGGNKDKSKNKLKKHKKEVVEEEEEGGESTPPLGFSKGKRGSEGSRPRGELEISRNGLLIPSTFVPNTQAPTPIHIHTFRHAPIYTSKHARTQAQTHSMRVRACEFVHLHTQAAEPTRPSLWQQTPSQSNRDKSPSCNPSPASPAPLRHWAREGSPLILARPWKSK